MKNFSECKKGFILALTAVALPFIIGILALVIDLSMAVMTKGQMQRAADLAAVSAVVAGNAAGVDNTLYIAPAGYAEAKAIAKANGFEDGVNGVTVTVRNISPSILSATGDSFLDPNSNYRTDVGSFEVTIAKTNLLTYFSNLVSNASFGNTNMRVRAVANGSTPCIIALRGTGVGFAVSSSSPINADCGIYVNSTASGTSNNSTAVSVGGSAGVDVQYMYVLGSTLAFGSASLTGYILNNQVDPVPNPYYDPTKASNPLDDAAYTTTYPTYSSFTTSSTPTYSQASATTAYATSANSNALPSGSYYTATTTTKGKVTTTSYNYADVTIDSAVTTPPTNVQAKTLIVNTSSTPSSNYNVNTLTLTASGTSTSPVTLNGTYNVYGGGVSISNSKYYTFNSSGTTNAVNVINGDLAVAGSLTTTTGTNTTYYINGNLDISGTANLGPGTYYVSGDLKVTGSATLGAGTYYVGGNFTGGGGGAGSATTVNVNNATVILTGSDASYVSMGAGTSLVMTAPETGTWKGISIFQSARAAVANSNLNTFQASTGTNFSIKGVVALPAQDVTLSAGSGYAKACTLWLVGRFSFSGGGQLGNKCALSSVIGSFNSGGLVE